MKEQFIGIAWNLVGLFTVPLLAMVIYKALNKLADKWHIEFTSAQEAQLKTIADQSALAAEEWAAQKIKAAQQKPTQDEKLNFAVDAMTTQLPGLQPKDAISLIKGALPRLNLGAAFSLIKKVL